MLDGWEVVAEMVVSILEALGSSTPPAPSPASGAITANDRAYQPIRGDLRRFRIRGFRQEPPIPDGAGYEATAHHAADSPRPQG